MEPGNATLIALLIILSLGLIPELFKKFRIPFVTLIILLGAIFGPNGLDYIEFTEIISFFGFMGMTFLMLMAGLETDLSKLKQSKRKIAIMSSTNGLIPFLVGLGIILYFGYPFKTALLIGIVFISSSVAIIVPTLRSAGIFSKDLGQLILSSVLVTDIVSLIALGFLFQSESPITSFSLPAYIVILLLSIALLFFTVPRLSEKVIKRFKGDQAYEKQLRIVIVIFLALLVYFFSIGVHPILAAFLVGLTLSETIKHDKEDRIYSKIHTLGYGLFVPIFFFIVGMEMDLALFKSFDITNIIMISLISGLIFSKAISGFIAGRLVKLDNRRAMLFGTISIAQLTTTLAVTYAAASLKIIDETLTTSIILLSILTTFLAPVIVSWLNRK